MQTKDPRVAEMTQEEKARFLRGDGNWNTPKPTDKNIHSVRMSDGPIGVRKEKVNDGGPLSEAMTSVCLPSGALLASSFDRNLAEEFGKVLGNEAKAYGVNVILGPAINIKRSPLGGRGFEYYSEDPYVVGEMAGAYIVGVQSQGIGTSVKHFAANSQETARMNINEIIDERALREIYLKGFEKAIKKGDPYTVMVSYNKINGVHATENPWLLTQVLRNEWSYSGLTISDWGAVNDPAKSVEAGLDLEMPEDGDINQPAVLKAIQTSPKTEEAADQAITRTLKLIDRCPALTMGSYDLDKDHAFAKKAAEESIVLLKNESVLPLRKEEKIAVIGQFAKAPRYQGGGSSHINSYQATSFLDLLKGVDYSYQDGYDLSDPNSDIDLLPAIKACQGRDKVLLFLGVPEKIESEGFDRADLKLPSNQQKLISELVKAGHRVILVLMNGGPLEMPFIDEVKGVLETYLGGEAVNEAIFDIVYGNVNPSGHLAETFPLHLEDCPATPYFPGDGFNVLYKESIYVGYRYYLTFHKKVLFPFGYGLSYSQFTYSDFTLEEVNGQYQASVKVKNTSLVPGKAVPQLYVSKPNRDIFNAEAELCGFEKIFLNAYEEKTVVFKVDPEVFTFFNAKLKKQVPLYGEYRFAVGIDCAHLLPARPVMKEGKNEDLPYTRNDVPAYYGENIVHVSDEEFSKLYGGKLPLTDKKAPFSLDTSLAQAILLGSKGAKALLDFLLKQDVIKADKALLRWSPMLRSAASLTSFRSSAGRT